MSGFDVHDRREAGDREEATFHSYTITRKKFYALVKEVKIGTD